jgi:hypothetical protein
MSEAYQGDRCISYTDEEWFAICSAFTTEPMNYLVLLADNDLKRYEWHTRWKEVDEYLHCMTAKELGLQRPVVLPAVGMNWDYWLKERTFKKAITGLYNMIDTLAAEGVKMILNHNSGWINGNTVKLGMDGADTSLYVGNGSCVVYDWQPLPDIRDTWYTMNKKMAKHEMAYYVWVTGFTQYYGTFYREVGEDPFLWALNKPTDNPVHNWPLWQYPYHNILNTGFEKIFNKKILESQRKYGFQGIWGDSYQLSWMSQLNWGDGSGESMQRKWWETISQWSQQGIGFMSEGVAFPGISCSIEVEDWQKYPWAFQNTCKWLRNGEHEHYNPDLLNALCFQLMANKGWLAFDILKWSYTGPYCTPSDVMPDFPVLSEMYQAALPYMHRPYVLINDRGMLWLHAKDNRKGVVFVFDECHYTEKITFKHMDGTPLTEKNRLFPNKVYLATSEDLLKDFGIQTGSLDDPRVGRNVEPIQYTWPD